MLNAKQWSQVYRQGGINRAIKSIVRGPSLPLPNGRHLRSRDGSVRDSFRVAFWLDEPNTLGDLVFQPDPLPLDVASQRLPPQVIRGLPHYPADLPNLFFGHYWRRGPIQPLAKNVMCLDYSAVLKEKLVAYRHRIGAPLASARAYSVEAHSEWL